MYSRQVPASLGSNHDRTRAPRPVQSSPSNGVSKIPIHNNAADCTRNRVSLFVCLEIQIQVQRSRPIAFHLFSFLACCVNVDPWLHTKVQYLNNNREEPVPYSRQAPHWHGGYNSRCFITSHRMNPVSAAWGQKNGSISFSHSLQHHMRAESQVITRSSSHRDKANGWGGCLSSQGALGNMQ